jgi:hypothetical protein
MNHLALSSLLLLGCPGSNDSNKDPIATPNEMPTVEILSPGYGASFSIGEDIDFLALARDAESPGPELSVSWTSSMDGDLFAGAADGDGNARFSGEELSIGGHTITVTTTDPDEGSASHSILVNVFNPGLPPSIAIVSPDSDEFGVAGIPLSLTAVVADDDDVLSDVSVVFTIVGEDQEATCSDEADEEGVATCALTLNEGVVQIQATATDPLGQTASDTLADFPITSADDHDDDGDGYAESDGDCDDEDSAVHPGSFELCDGIDNDCDGDTDGNDGDTDGDGDGHSSCGNVDCNDTDGDVHPGAEERCNDIDDDCDDVVDESDAVDAATWHHDSDGDGYGSMVSSTVACDAPPSYVADATDCDDGDDEVHPGATEVCDDDDTDEDCDGLADDSSASGKSAYYLDTDGDGYPTAIIYAFACETYGSYIESSGEWDCDDSRSDVNPGEVEECDPFDIDENCNGEAEEPGAEGGVIFYRDYDEDGYGDPLDSEVLCEAGDVVDYDVTNNEDCCDIDWQANPDWTEHRSIPNWCGDYDWDCDGSETKGLTTEGSCGLDFSICGADPPGWRYASPPSCGSSGDWVVGCDVDWWSASCDEVYTTMSQTCL